MSHVSGTEHDEMQRHHVEFRALAGAVEIRDVDALEATELEHVWSRCRDLGAPDDLIDRTVIDRDAFAMLDSRTFFEHVVSTATLAAIRSRRGSRILLHAAALADPETGATIALAAASGTGKTTAARTLGRTLAYLTDETTSIDADLGVEVFAKPLSVLVDGRRPKFQRSPDDLGLVPAVSPGRLAVLAVLQRDDDADLVEAIARHLTLPEALQLIIGQSSSLAALDRGLVQLCRVIDACGGVVCLRYREAEHLVPLATRLLADAAPAVESSWTAMDPAEWRVGGEAPSAPGTWLRRREPADAIEVDGLIGLLSEARFTALDGVGAAIWQVADAWLELDEVTERVVGRLGEHPDAAAIVAGAVDELIDEGALERRVVAGCPDQS